MRTTGILPALLLGSLLAACEGGEATEPVEPPPSEAPAEKAAPGEAHEHPAAAEAPAVPAVPEGAKVMWLEPAAGTVKGPERDGKVVVAVKMGAEGIAVEPAGEVKEGSGHHHILIDDGPLAVGTAVAKDATHIHFGGGQTEAEIEVTPGKHSLTLQFADGVHRSYGPALSATIEVEVESNGEQAPAAE